MTDKAQLPPHDLESEVTVLGALLCHERYAAMIPQDLTAKTFYSRAHSTVFDAILTVLGRGDPCGDGLMSAVALELRDSGRIRELTGGSSTLIEWSNEAPILTEKEFARHAAKIVKCATLRKLIWSLQLATANAYQVPDDLNEFLMSTERSIVELSLASRSSEPRKLRDVLREEIKTWVTDTERGEAKGVSTGFDRVDKTLGNLQEGDLVIVAARPGMGKTSLVTSIVKNVATKPSEAGLIFSLEMPAEQIAGRMLCTEAGISMKKIRRGRMSPDDVKNGTLAASTLGDLDVYIDDAKDGRPSVSDIAMKSRRMAAKLSREGKRLRLIVVDYLQIVKLSASLQNQRHDLAIGEVSIELKSLAKQLGCTVIACAQLSRDVERRQDKRPVMSDLRESGQIEQDADIILMLYREDYYESKKKDVRSSEKEASGGVVEVIVEKNRNGPKGVVPLYFDGPTTKFSNLAEGEWD